MNVIGSGLIGRTFQRVDSGVPIEPLIVIAAGVSDSRCIDEEEYTREYDLILKTCVDASVPVTYISSYSIHEQQTRSSMYIRNKLRCEQVVLKANRKNTILRLPNVVGTGGNQNNILQFLIEKIRSQSLFKLIEGVHRNFIDVEDIPKFLEFALTNYPEDRVYEMVHPKSYSIMEVLKVLENYLGISAKKFETVSQKENNYVMNHIAQEFYELQPGKIEDPLPALLKKYKL